jgi:hypothetical protein
MSAHHSSPPPSAPPKSSAQQQLITGAVAAFANGTIALKPDLDVRITLKTFNANERQYANMCSTLHLERTTDGTVVIKTEGSEQHFACQQESLGTALRMVLPKGLGSVNVSLSLAQYPKNMALSKSLMGADFSMAVRTLRTKGKKSSVLESEMHLADEVGKHVLATFDASTEMTMWMQ